MKINKKYLIFWSFFLFILKHQNPWYDVSELHWIRQSLDLGTLKLWKGGSGVCQVSAKLSYESFWSNYVDWVIEPTTHLARVASAGIRAGSSGGEGHVWELEGKQKKTWQKVRYGNPVFSFNASAKAGQERVCHCPDRRDQDHLLRPCRTALLPLGCLLLS